MPGICHALESSNCLITDVLSDLKQISYGAGKSTQKTANISTSKGHPLLLVQVEPEKKETEKIGSQREETGESESCNSQLAPHTQFQAQPSSSACRSGKRSKPPPLRPHPTAVRMHMLVFPDGASILHVLK